jgi:RimJ/RimL family protein N-acetyltransferase
MIQLQQFEKGGYATLISWVDNPEMLMQFAGPALVFPLTEEQLDQSLSDTNRFAFTIADTATGAPVGYAEINLTDKTACLGRILIGDKSMRGKGLGTQVVQLLLAYAFSRFDKTVAELNVFNWNTAAIKCYEKAGFTINPGKKLERKINGETWTAINMVINKEKWARQDNH